MEVFGAASSSAGGSRQSVLVGMALAVNVFVRSEFGTEMPATGFVAEGVSVLNNHTFQLTSNL